ncbi:CHAT domain-containing protein [Phycicoccus flavus]|uniref:CHAT domain-containing protein n=1 Tax=Phycicoccus flavus TaxID=2502783 RepID=A0A8T6R0M8_9MICO|nr:CHAT domain-containing protein [Phycicoccus flavus]NHA67497.1 CHAT domain-containing protein [Phycicoccus flavus]
MAAARHANEVGRFEDAAESLDEALGLVAGRADRDARWLWARVLITRAWAELELRGHRPALLMLREARAAAVELDDALLTALSWIQEGLLHGRVWSYEAALTALEQVTDESVLDPAQRWALHLNRGQAHLGVGRSADAARETEVALGLAVEHGLPEQEFKARHNLAKLAFVDGDLGRALVLMRAVDATDAAVVRDRARLDYAEVLAEAGLVDAARRVLADALATARAASHRLEEGEIGERIARCDLLVGDLDGARDHLRGALAAYRTRQAHGLVRDAELLRLTVDVAAGVRLAEAVTSLTRLADGRGLALTPADRDAVRVEAEARVLLGDPASAERRLDALGEDDVDQLGARLHTTLVRARIHDARGRSEEAAACLAEGSRLLAAQQFRTSSLELRAALALHARRLRAFDLDRATAAGDPDDVLATVERWRAISHRVNPVAAPTDPELVDLTRDLRRLRQLGAVGGPEHARELAPQVAELEAQVAEREWVLVRTAGSAVTGAPVTADEARAAAADRGTTVVELLEHDGAWHAVVLADGPATLLRLGDAAPAAALVTQLRRDLRARATLAPSSPMAAALHRATQSSLTRVDALLAPALGDSGRLVVVPSQSLAGLPWNLLPSLAGRPVSVAPSLTRWVRGPRRDGTPPGAATARALYGPGLEHTGPEVAAVRRAWSQAPRGGDGPARSEDVVAALAGARVVHLAAHGTHEAQSPLFSSVRMADGPVFAHELPRPLTAEHVVLAACDVGQFSTRAGEEPLGLATALLSLGAHSVLAAVAPVGDALAAEAMVEHHRRLAAGADATAAWAEVVAAVPAAGVFSVYGSEWSAGPA